jgi:hypothetical protein
MNRKRTAARRLTLEPLEDRCVGPGQPFRGNGAPARRRPRRRPCRGPRERAAGVPDDARGGLPWCGTAAGRAVRAPATRWWSPRPRWGR